MSNKFSLKFAKVFEHVLKKLQGTILENFGPIIIKIWNTEVVGRNFM